MRYAKIAIQSDGTGALDSTEAFDKLGPGLVRWYGGTNAGGLTWGDRPVNLGDLVLPLPESASGCRDIHRPLLDLFRRELGGGVPLDSLSDEWEVIEDDRGSVVEVEVTYCASDEDLDMQVLDYEADATHIYAAIDPRDWADPSGYTEDNDGDMIVTLFVAVSDDGEAIGAYEAEGDAIDALQQRRDESRYGYPWAHNWAYYVEGRYLVDDLQAAGFTVAEQTETGHLFCGIDGGGYDFQSAHHVVFAALRLARYGGKVDTSGGFCIPVGPVR